METKSTKELKEALDLVLGGISVVGQAKADGKIDMNDLAFLIQLMPKIGPALDGVGEIPSEVSDLSAEEVADMASHVMARLAVDDAKAKALISGGFKVIGGAVEIIKGLKA